MENIFSWSKSRDEEFRECQRKYFYDRYASWGGWEKSAAKEARLAYVLKNLKNRWAWKGETVHHIIENVLKSARIDKSIPLEVALDELTHVMRRDYKSSKAKRNWEDPKKNRGLFEHEYEKPISDDAWKKVHDSSVECLKNFYGSELYKELLADDKDPWLMIEDLEEFDFEGAKIFVKLDFARRKGERIEIYDWKTGKEENGGEPTVQIGAYAIYAMQKWKTPLEGLKAYLFNLSNPAPTPQEQILTEALIEKTKSTMRESIEAMRAMLEDASKNIPKPRENFKFTENTRLCNFCNFYKICEKYKTK